VSAEIWYLTASVSATACALLATVVVVAGWRRRLAEVAVLGAALFVVSVLPLVSGLGGTDLFGGAPASGWAASLALPGAVIAALPLLGASRLIRRWRIWVPSAMGSATLVAAALASDTDTPPSVIATPLLIVSGIGTMLLMRRQWALFRISGLRSPFVACIAIGFIALATIAGSRSSPGSFVSWLGVITENIGVLVAGLAVLVGYRLDRSVADVLAPIASLEPLTALEIGLSPEIHAFVAALDRKDSITRDHVVRTSALALRVALRAGFDHSGARAVAIGALLHDVGKLVVPSEILKKPAALTDEEFLTIKSHPEAGERLLQSAPSLRSATRFVRGHHERFDGRGYPDGLSGDEIGIDLGIVSAVDAWDAMTNVRQYRDGMPTREATRILREGAGSQWHPEAVRLVLDEVRQNPAVDLTPMSAIGRRAAEGQICDCLADVIGSDATVLKQRRT